MPPILDELTALRAGSRGSVVLGVALALLTALLLLPGLAHIESLTVRAVTRGVKQQAARHYGVSVLAPVSPPPRAPSRAMVTAPPDRRIAEAIVGGEARFAGDRIEAGETPLEAIFFDGSALTLEPGTELVVLDSTSLHGPTPAVSLHRGAVNVRGEVTIYLSSAVRAP